MRTIYKYQVKIIERQMIRIPENAQFLQIRWQGIGPQMWMEVDSLALTREAYFGVFGTGHPIPDGATWLGIAEDVALGLIWHVYALGD